MARAFQWLQVCLFTLAGALVAPAQEQLLTTPGRGNVALSLSTTWTPIPGEAPAGAPPTFTWSRTGKVRGNLQVSVLWSPTGDPAFTRPDKVRAFCLAGQAAFKDGMVERELPLQPLQGTQGAGFWYEGTDKAYPAIPGKPALDEYPVLTHGELALGDLLLSFTILSDGKGDEAVREALAALRGAALRGLTASPIELRAAGVALRVDLQGFTQRMGEKHFHGAYYQLGYFTSDASGLICSILVDDLRGKTLEDLEKAGIGQSQGPVRLLPGSRVNSVRIEAPRGYLISYPSGIPGVTPPDQSQAQWYFETIHQGRWLELHFSKLVPRGADLGALEAEVLRVVRSLQVQP